jgi:hypothetical protein
MDAAQRRFHLLAALCGIAGVVALGAYFVLPPPTPPANASAAEVTRIATQSRDLFYLFAWLQAAGSLLSAIFFLALIHLANATTRFAGLAAQVGVAVLLSVALIEGVLTIDVAAATANGHPATALTSYDLMGQFIHIYPIVPAPMIFVALGAALVDASVLPKTFAWLAMALGGAFAIVGLVGLFNPVAANAVVALLIGEELWLAAAAIALVVGTVRTGLPGDGATHGMPIP